MNKEVMIKWKSLKDEVIRRGGNGEDVVDALMAHHALYDKGLLAWLGGLYDSKVGGFYYSNSARRSEDPRLKPEGGAPDEGDVNATVMSATSLTGDIYGTLMLGEYRIPLYSKEDLPIFIDALNLQDK